MLPQDFKEWAYNLKGEEQEAVKELLTAYLMKEKFFYTLPDGSKVRGGLGTYSVWPPAGPQPCSPGLRTLKTLTRTAHTLCCNALLASLTRLASPVVRPQVSMWDLQQYVDNNPELEALFRSGRHVPTADPLDPAGRPLGRAGLRPAELAERGLVTGDGVAAVTPEEARELEHDWVGRAEGRRGDGLGR